MTMRMISVGVEGPMSGNSFGRRKVAFAGVPVGVTLWHADLDQVSDDLLLDEAWLSQAEHARAECFGSARLRAIYVAGRAFLRWVLGAELSMAPGALPIHEGRRGRPQLEDQRTVDFNVSHTGSRAVVALLHDPSDRFRVGVDIERFDRKADSDRLACRVLSSDEQASIRRLSGKERQDRFLHYWTCKEALSKTTGDGLIAPFSRLTIDLADGPRLVSGPHPYLPEACRLHSTTIGAGEYLVAVALLAHAGRRLNTDG